MKMTMVQLLLPGLNNTLKQLRRINSPSYCLNSYPLQTRWTRFLKTRDPKTFIFGNGVVITFITYLTITDQANIDPKQWKIGNEATSIKRSLRLVSIPHLSANIERIGQIAFPKLECRYLCEVCSNLRKLASYTSKSGSLNYGSVRINNSKIQSLTLEFKRVNLNFQQFRRLEFATLGKNLRGSVLGPRKRIQVFASE